MATTQCFTTAFDASGHPPPLFAAFGLIFVAIAALLLIFRKSEIVRMHWHGPRGCQTGFAVFMLCFAILWTTLAAGATVQDWWTVNHGSTQVVEGVVEQFHPMPFTGHDTEHELLLWLGESEAAAAHVRAALSTSAGIAASYNEEYARMSRGGSQPLFQYVNTGKALAYVVRAHDLAI